MKNGQLTDSWNLNKREKAATFELGLAECLSQILAVFVEVDEASIHINQHANHATNDNSIWSVCGSTTLSFNNWLAINIIILTPFWFIKGISTHKVYTPNIFLHAQILIHQKVFTANSNADPGILLALISAPAHFINSILEIILRFAFGIWRFPILLQPHFRCWNEPSLMICRSSNAFTLFINLYFIKAELVVEPEIKELCVTSIASAFYLAVVEVWVLVFLLIFFYEAQWLLANSQSLVLFQHFEIFFYKFSFRFYFRYKVQVLKVDVAMVLDEFFLLWIHWA